MLTAGRAESGGAHSDVVSLAVYDMDLISPSKAIEDSYEVLAKRRLVWFFSAPNWGDDGCG